MLRGSTLILKEVQDDDWADSVPFILVTGRGTH
jgi:hypothetical protein